GDADVHALDGGAVLHGFHHALVHALHRLDTILHRRRIGIPRRRLGIGDLELAPEIGEPAFDHGAHSRVAPHHVAPAAIVIPAAAHHHAAPHHAHHGTAAAHHAHGAAHGLGMGGNAC